MFSRHIKFSGVCGFQQHDDKAAAALQLAATPLHLHAQIDRKVLPHDRQSLATAKHVSDSRRMQPIENVCIFLNI